MYDSANQLIRENNQKLGKTWTWSYDSAGNILSKGEYAYTTGELGTPIDTVTYTYGDADWGDLLTGYDGKTVTSDEIGNMLSDGVHNYTWEHGRQLAAMDSWTFQYDAGGMRTRRYDSETGTAYTYRYNDGLLRQMIISSDEVSGSFTFRYDNTGKPISFYYNLTDEENAVTYSGEAFYLVNAQGDVIGLISDEMDSVGSYTYDAWGVVKSVQVYDDAFELVVNLNPLRYRGYVYDHETGLYYLQSRYYNPEMGRFINADGVVSGVGGKVLGYNMFAYCFNNPVNMTDNSGTWPSWNDIKTGFNKAVDWVDNNIVQPVLGFAEDIIEDCNNYDSNNQSEEKVLESNYFSSYKGVPVIRTNGDRSGSFGAIFLTRETNNRSNPEDVLRHEYGHTKQLKQLGILTYALCIGLPSWQEWGTGEYYSKPWEITADIYGGVQSRNHSQSNIDRGFRYLKGSKIIGPFIWMFIE